VITTLKDGRVNRTSFLQLFPPVLQQSPNLNVAEVVKEVNEFYKGRGIGMAAPFEVA